MNHPSSALACRFGVVLILSMFLLAACGGGGGGTAVAPLDPGPGTGVLPSQPESLVIPNADSYSPLYFERQDETSPQIAWLYRVNDGQPLAVDGEDGTFELTFPELMLVSFDPNANLRVSNLPFRYTGTVPGRSEPVTGLGWVDILELFDRADGCPQIQGRTSMLSMSDEADEPVFSIGANSQLDYQVPLRWIPDCPDLDTQLGFETGGAVDLADTHLLGSMASFVDGAVLRSNEFEDSPGTPDEWVVSEVLDECTVQDRVFTDVVCIDLTTLVPDLARPESPEHNNVRTVRMWFAKGVGLIRAEGALLFWGQPVDLDLVDVLR